MAYYELKRIFKKARWQVRRLNSARRFGKKVLDSQPIIIVNSIPKAGSHLLTQVIDGVIAVSPLIDSGYPPINRAENNLKMRDDQDKLARLHELNAGDVAYGYLKSKPDFLAELGQDKYSLFFLYRDPRDVVVSQVQYATYMKEDHHLHLYYNEKFDTDEARINAAIRGIDDELYGISSIKVRYDGYAGWINLPNVLPVKFEDLILDRDATFVRILEFLKGRGLVLMTSDEEAIASMHAAVQPKKSGTFRKGQPGGWKEAFTEENKHVFKEEAGDLVVRLGYEENMDW